MLITLMSFLTSLSIYIHGIFLEMNLFKIEQKIDYRDIYLKLN